MIGSDFTRRLGEREILLTQGVARYLGRVGFVPFDDQGVPPFLRRPKIAGDHRYALRNLHHRLDTWHRAGGVGLDAFHLGAKQRRTGYQRRQQARQFKVPGKLGLSDSLCLTILARQAFADDLPVGGCFQLHALRWRQFGGLGDQFAIRGSALGLEMDNTAALGLERSGCHLPQRGGSSDQHLARGGARLAQLVPRIGQAGAAAGTLRGSAPGQIAVELGVGWRGFDPNLFPGHLQFLGDQHRQAGVDALPHFQVLHQHGDGIVRRDAQKSVGRE